MSLGPETVNGIAAEPGACNKAATQQQQQMAHVAGPANTRCAVRGVLPPVALSCTYLMTAMRVHEVRATIAAVTVSPYVCRIPHVIVCLAKLRRDNVGLLHLHCQCRAAMHRM